RQQICSELPILFLLKQLWLSHEKSPVDQLLIKLSHHFPLLAPTGRYHTLINQWENSWIHGEAMEGFVHLLQKKRTSIDTELLTTLMDQWKNKEQYVRQKAVETFIKTLQEEPVFINIEHLTTLTKQWEDDREYVREAAMEAFTKALQIKPTLINVEILITLT